MTKERFLTVRWNNWLSLALGLPTLIYVVVAFSTSVWSGRGGPCTWWPLSRVRSLTRPRPLESRSILSRGRTGSRFSRP